ncbi:MAG TPA: RsbRD N-terminal domain-containing protein [Thermodesulfobacteriota bacterium]|nr:RsbRD N-terminal domain-containing protein [Thermodesulfobacteriota bacterium]
MIFKDLLLKNKGAVLDKWLHLILETYPAGTSKFMRQEKDRFINPVGHTLIESTEALYEGLLQGMEADQLAGYLERIIQIRSTQDFSPSQAVVIIPALKMALREEMKRSGIEIHHVMEEWFAFASRIDQLSLVAFDIYTKYREKIYEIRINEIKKERDRAFKLLERTHSIEKHRDPETSSG